MQQQISPDEMEQLRQDAEAGDAGAQFELAREWYEKAADAGHEEAQEALEEMGEKAW